MPLDIFVFTRSESTNGKSEKAFSGRHLPFCLNYFENIEQNDE